MKQLTPIRDKVIGKMVDTVGATRFTPGGIILGADTPDAEDFVRARWFEVTHVGPDQKEIKVGEWVLVPHGRWGHGFDLEGTFKEENKLFHIDTEAMMIVSDERPE